MTAADLINLCSRAELRPGVNQKAWEEFKRRSFLVAKAVCNEQGIKPRSQEAIRLPPTTPLGEHSSQLFREFESWVEEKNGSLIH